MVTSPHTTTKPCFYVRKDLYIEPSFSVQVQQFFLPHDIFLHFLLRTSSLQKSISLLQIILSFSFSSTKENMFLLFLLRFFSFSMQKHFPFFLTPFVLSYAKIFSSSSFSVLLLLHPKIYSFPNICLLFSFRSILSSAKRIFFIQIFLSFSSSVFLPLRNKYIFLLQIFKCPISFVDLKWAQLYDSLVLETSEVHLQNFCPNLLSYLSTCPQISIEKWKIRKIWMWRKRPSW